MATKIKHLKDEEGKFYPYTHESAVVTDDGTKLGDKLTQLDLKVGDVSQLDEKVAAEDLVKAINKAAQQGGGGEPWLVYADVTLTEEVSSFVYNASELKSARIIFTGGGSEVTSKYFVINSGVFDGTIQMPKCRYGVVDLVNCGNLYKASYCSSFGNAIETAVSKMDRIIMKYAQNIGTITISIRNENLPVGARIIIYGQQ